MAQPPKKRSPRDRTKVAPSTPLSRPRGPVSPPADFQEPLDEQAQQRERAAAWIAQNWRVPANCIVCGNNNWQIGDVFELRAFRGGTLVIGGTPLLPVFPVSCNVCGNTVFINAIVSGVVGGDES